MTESRKYVLKENLVVLLGEAVCAALRARADGAIKYYYPLVKECSREKKEAKRLRGYVKEALWLNKNGKEQQKGFLRLVTRVGYRLFLVSPGLYKLITKVGN